MDADAGVRWAARVLTLLAGLSFVGWLATLVPFLLPAAILLVVGAYAFFLVDRRRILTEIARPPAREDDRVLEGSETVVSPEVSAGGIPLTYMTRSRSRAKR